MFRKYMLISILCFVFVMPTIFSAEPVPPASSQVSVQQFILVVQKQNDQLKKDIIANEDANMKQFDARMTGMLAGFLRKLVIGLLGGMMVVLVGYAAIISYITNKFTPTAQRNLFRTKMSAAIGQGRMIPQGAVVQSPIIVQREGQSDNLKSRPTPVSTYSSDSEPDFGGFDFSPKQQQPTEQFPNPPAYKMSGGRKALIYALVFAFIILAYLSVRYYLTHMGVVLPSIGGNSS